MLDLLIFRWTTLGIAGCRGYTTKSTGPASVRDADNAEFPIRERDLSGTEKPRRQAPFIGYENEKLRYQFGITIPMVEEAGFEPATSRL